MLAIMAHTPGFIQFEMMEDCSFGRRKPSAMLIRRGFRSGASPGRLDEPVETLGLHMLLLLTTKIL